MKRIITVLVVAFISTIFSNPLLAQKQITLEDIWASRNFMAERIDALNSMNDGEHYSSLDQVEGAVEINKYNYKTGSKVQTIFSSAKVKNPITNKDLAVIDYKFSADETKLILTTETEQIYRHSFVASYFIYDIATGKVSAVDKATKQQLPDFSPAGDKVAYVQNNNIYIEDVATGQSKMITTDGKKNQIINGATDWVYEEEFGFDKAFFWNKDGSKIAYYKFDESAVKEFNMPTYGTLYPNDNKFKYPKAGEANSVVSIYIYDVKRGETKKMNLGTVTDQYIPRIAWTNDVNTLCIARMNRLQNKVELLLANFFTGDTGTMYTEESQSYIDIHESEPNFFYFLDDNKSFVVLSEKDGYAHLYHYDMKGKLINQITKGNWDVLTFYGINTKTKMLYYSSSETSATQENIYSVKLDGKGKKLLTLKNGTNNAVFNNTYTYFINTNTAANTPHYITLNDGNGAELRVLENNQGLNDRLKEYQLTKKEFFSFKTSEGVELNGWMIKPANFDASKKYPVLMHVYGGPGRNTVQDAWGGSDYFWHQMLAQKGYIVVSVDNRGTGARGKAFKHATYKQLGKLETQDQIEAAKHLGNLPYVDKARIGMQGWSFGGYLTSLCMTKGADYFKAGIAVAPVTNWRYYDSIYTERFLQTPQLNASGYDDNSPINFVKDLKGSYLLVHGTADDNVHFQNSVEMVNALVKANKQFDLMMYPDKNHGIYGGNSRLHLYTKMTNFILKNI
ncbi:MAG: DPP IV N-terminal domain-containing protein [Bacteroidota bacterium]